MHFGLRVAMQLYLQNSIKELCKSAKFCLENNFSAILSVCSGVFVFTSHTLLSTL
ncbi:hypothetical protein HOG21_04260 [bacterium]|nr:hypothetical protein [bacterium]